jgi:hypothetical protein
MDHRRSIFEKIADKAKDIANIAANAANYALKDEERQPKAQRRLSRAGMKTAAKRSKRAAH